MAEFRFRGEIPGSKSVFNRALIVQSYFPSLDLKGFSDCDDVRHMRESLRTLLTSTAPLSCGEGGTTFRFLALRASRKPGRHVLEAEPRLLQRPQKGLLEILHQLGVKAGVHGTQLVLEGQGWQRPSQTLRVDTSESSQYASALVLNAWQLDFDLEFELIGTRVSESYFDLTMNMLKEFGLQSEKTTQGYRIPQGQKVTTSEFVVEADLSSAFTMAAAGALTGETVIENFPLHSDQPDRVFVDILKRMGIGVTQESSVLTVKSASLKSVDCDLFQSPDLFPVLAVLCSWAEGTSKLYNAPHLVKKESNRIQKVAELLDLVGIHHQILPDGMIIHGNPQQRLREGLRFDPDKDHRMVMAASLMKLKGHGITILYPEAINKSFPEFWGMIGLQP